jgi:transposase
MEAVLQLYAETSDPEHPRVCFDETSKQLVQEVRPPQPAAPGQPARYDYEYQRNGVANLFLFYSPDHAAGGWRHVEVTEQRTKIDFAHQMKALADEHFPEAKTIRVVLDNLNTHTPAALYEAFEAEEARRLTSRLEFVYTPKHGSWLNQAELELAALTRQCLEERVPDVPTLRRQVAAWEAPRNEAGLIIRWLFRVAHARTKLKHLYPSLS